MKYPSKVLEEAVNAVAALPGIGKKSALRIVLHLLHDEHNKAEKLSNVLSIIKSDIKHCKHCFMLADEVVCDICNTPSRNNGILCVVESVRDVMAIEDTAQYNGRYHVLGGVISPLDGVGPDQLQIESLVQRINEEDISEIIMAISPTIEGETTIYYISKRLSGVKVKITAIARGVSFGGELEYADEFTLGKSINARMPYHVE